MEDISIFAVPHKYVKRSARSPWPHLYRGSSVIRGEQVSERLNAKYNPIDGYDKDLCIYVKPSNLDNIKDGAYVDIVDLYQIISLLEKRPKIRIIASSGASYNYLKSLGLKNDIFFIPQHHCNFERISRKREGLTVAGYIGSRRAFGYPNKELEKTLSNLKIKLLTNFDFRTREEVISFYRNIDFQVIWTVNQHVWKFPLKIINAASFGIPTIAYQNVGYEEANGEYMKAENMGDVENNINLLNNEKYYFEWSRKIMEYSESYHIDNIIEKYKNLPK